VLSIKLRNLSFQLQTKAERAEELVDNVDVTRCEALEELVQKVRLFAISECACFFAFAFATFANLEGLGLEDKERLFATYRSNF